MLAAILKMGFEFIFNEGFFLRTLKIKIFTNKAHSVPPLVPVNSNHCIQLVLKAKTFPKINQLHERSQIVCRNSYPIHNGISSQIASGWFILFLRLEKKTKTILINNELKIKAAQAPPKDARLTHQVVARFQIKKVR
jgi:hypothetical protein